MAKYVYTMRRVSKTVPPQRAPNEHLLASVACDALRLMAGLMWDLGEAQSLPRQ